MNKYTELGLSADLWAVGRDREPLRTALTIAHAMHWAPRVRNALRLNRERRRSPASFKELAMNLGRDPRNIHRWKAGEQQAVVVDFVALSALLAIPISELFPPLAWWICQATLSVCGTRVTMTDSLSYGAYLACRPSVNREGLDLAALESVSENVPPYCVEQCRTCVLRAANAVGVALDHAGWRLTDWGNVAIRAALPVS